MVYTQVQRRQRVKSVPIALSRSSTRDDLEEETYPPLLNQELDILLGPTTIPFHESRHFKRHDRSDEKSSETVIETYWYQVWQRALSLYDRFTHEPSKGKTNNPSQILLYLLSGFLIFHLLGHFTSSYFNGPIKRDHYPLEDDYVPPTASNSDTPYHPSLDSIAIGIDPGTSSSFSRVPTQLISFLSVAKNVIAFTPELKSRQDEVDSRISWEMEAGFVLENEDSNAEMQEVVDSIAGRSAASTLALNKDDANRVIGETYHVQNVNSRGEEANIKSKEGLGERDSMDLNIKITDDIETHGPFVIATADPETIYHPLKTDTLAYFEELYTRFPRIEWYILISDTSYILWSNMLQALAQYNPENPLYLGNPSSFEGCANQNLPLTTPRGKFQFFAQSSSGIILSRAAMKALYYNIPTCRTRKFSHDCQSGEIQLSLCLREKGISLTPLAGLYSSMVGDGFTFPIDACQVPLIIHPVSHDGMGILTSLGRHWEEYYNSVENLTPIRLADVYKKWESWHQDEKNSPWDVNAVRQGTQRFLLSNITGVTDFGCHASCHRQHECLSYSFRYPICELHLDPKKVTAGSVAEEDVGEKKPEDTKAPGDDASSIARLTAPSNALGDKVIIPFEEREKFERVSGENVIPRKNTKWTKRLSGLQEKSQCQMRCDSMVHCKTFVWIPPECAMYRNIPPLKRAQGYASGAMRDRYTCPPPKPRSFFFG